MVDVVLSGDPSEDPQIWASPLVTPSAVCTVSPSGMDIKGNDRQWCLTMYMSAKLLRLKLLQTPDDCIFCYMEEGWKEQHSSVVDDRFGKQMVFFFLILTCVNRRVCTDLSFKGLFLWSVNRRINTELTFTVFNGQVSTFEAFQACFLETVHIFLPLDRRKLLINIFRCCHYLYLVGLLEGCVTVWEQRKLLYQTQSSH